MPKLDAEKRKSINERLALHEELRKSFEGRTYFTQHCHLCNWASNGLTFDEADEENQRHEATHPETAQIRVTEIDLWEVLLSLHDHDCQMALCSCKCGCQEGPFCVLVLGPLCSTCSVREMRGDSEHGETH